MSWDPVSYLKSRHTRVLLGLRDACHKYHGEYNVNDNQPGYTITLDQVLAELKTREHIPGKQEAKLLRRLMAQNRLTAEQVRAVPKYATLLAQAQYRRVVDAQTYERYRKCAPNATVTKKMLVRTSSAVDGQR